MVFLTGIYGSGKSTLCDRLCSTSTIQYIRASDLIYREKHTLPPTNKRINQVNENQQYLIQALQKLSFTQTPILLEGHSCLLNKQLAVERISPDVFQQMNISAIILQKRLLRRDNTSYTLTELSALQEAEQVYSHHLAHLLQCPLLILEDPSSADIKRLLQFIVQSEKKLENRAKKCYSNIE